MRLFVKVWPDNSVYSTYLSAVLCYLYTSVSTCRSCLGSDAKLYGNRRYLIGGCLLRRVGMLLRYRTMLGSMCFIIFQLTLDVVEFFTHLCVTKLGFIVDHAFIYIESISVNWIAVSDFEKYCLWCMLCAIMISLNVGVCWIW